MKILYRLSCQAAEGRKAISGNRFVRARYSQASDVGDKCEERFRTAKAFFDSVLGHQVRTAERRVSPGLSDDGRRSLARAITRCHNTGDGLRFLDSH